MRDTPTRVSVVVVRGDRILMVQHRDADGLLWILSGGGVMPGESLPATRTGLLPHLAYRCLLDTDELDSAHNVDGEVVYGVGWKRISEEHPIRPLTPRF